MARHGFLFILLGVGFLFACNRDHKPAAHRAKVTNERMMAHRPPAKLTADGLIPSKGDGSGAQLSAVEKKYNSLCASCHGADGAANSPVAQAMAPKPRDFTDSAWQAQVDDARVAKVIKEGGASVGLSATMAAWGALLSDSQIDEMVKMIRDFGSK